MVLNKITNFFSLGAIILLFCLPNDSANADVLLADSLADWNTATSDGIDEYGNAVSVGSSQDAAQQGHAATSNGIWNYKGTNGPATGTFSSAPGFLTTWTNNAANPGSAGCYAAPGYCRMSGTTMQPASTFVGTTYAVREWVGSGLAGETLRIAGSFDTLANIAPISTFNNGVHALIILNNSIVLFDELIFPGGIENFDFLTTILPPNPMIRFAVGPQGPGPAVIGSQDFFNDRTVFSAQIEQVTTAVSAPSAFLILLSGLLAIRRLSQSRGALHTSRPR